MTENQYIFVKVSNGQFQHFRYLTVFKTDLVSICGRWSCVFAVAHPLAGMFYYVFYIASLSAPLSMQQGAVEPLDPPRRAFTVSLDEKESNK